MSVTVDLSGQLRRGTRGAPMFSDLSPYFRARAARWFERLAARWDGRLPNWRKAILAGQAKRLARIPDASLPGWGRRMVATKGAHARWPAAKKGASMKKKTVDEMTDSEVRRALAELGVPAPDKITAIERWVLSLPDDFPGANPSETPPQKTTPRTRAVARPVDSGKRRR